MNDSKVAAVILVPGTGHDKLDSVPRSYAGLFNLLAVHH